MKARARLVADDGWRVLVSEPPLALRATRECVYLVGSSASPIGGDDIGLDVLVAAGSACTVKTSAASVALPGPNGDESRYVVRARVGDNACLRWQPEPLVAAAGCRHVAHAYVDVASSAVVTWREELILGRAREEPGRCTTRLHVDRGGLPLLRHDIVVDAHSRSIGVLGDARAIGTLLVIGRTLPHAPCNSEDLEAEVFAIADDASLVTLVSQDVARVRAVIDDLVAS